MRQFMFRLKYFIHKHRLMGVYMLCAISTTFIILVGSLVNVAWPNPILTKAMTVLTICLNLGTAYFTWLLYKLYFLKDYRKFQEDHAVRVERYNALKVAYSESNTPFPAWLTPPTDFAKSYRKLRWMYFVGIGVNVFLFIMNAWRLFLGG